jgi:hypothetical protein
MILLAESENYQVFYDYESVDLISKATGKTITIGDFYGEPNVAIISPDEKFVAMAGCGLIVYFIKEPFRHYEYDKLDLTQWNEWFRNTGNELWISSIQYVNSQTIKIVDETGISRVLNIYS